MGAVILPQHHTALHERLSFLQKDQNAIGAVPNAYDCWLVQRGAKTFANARTQRSPGCTSAGEESCVKEVIYPGLASHPRHEVARRSLSLHATRLVQAESEHNPDGPFPYDGMVSSRIRGGLEEARHFLSTITISVFTPAVSLGGIESLAELPVPALMTHCDIPPAERTMLGISDDLILLSVGFEDDTDLVRDIEQALRAAVEGRPIA